jgi:hypothetical protein
LVNTDNVSRDDWILAGITLALIITLLFLPWFSIPGVTAGSITIASVNFTATEAPDSGLGLLAVLAAALLLLDLGFDRLSPQTEVPSINGSRTQTRLVLASIAALFVALKFLFDLHFSLFGFGFWVAAVLTAAMVYVAYQVHSSRDSTADRV